MPANSKLLAVILGGGAGNRLFPLTQQRSKPAVPLGGKYRLVDIALSNCINSDILRTFVLTQYNSASLNRHIAQTYRFSQFSNGFVEIIAAEQTPESPQWFQGTADAVRQAALHFRVIDAEYYLVLASRGTSTPRPASRARTIASARVVAPSFQKMFVTWLRTVLSLMRS